MYIHFLRKHILKLKFGLKKKLYQVAQLEEENEFFVKRGKPFIDKIEC